jgi:hypothetical protein
VINFTLSAKLSRRSVTCPYYFPLGYNSIDGFWRLENRRGTLIGALDGPAVVVQNVSSLMTYRDAEWDVA